MSKPKNELVSCTSNEKPLSAYPEEYISDLVPDIVFDMLNAQDTIYEEEASIVKELLADKNLTPKLRMKLVKNLQQSGKDVRYMKISIAAIVFVLCPIAIGIAKRISG